MTTTAKMKRIIGVGHVVKRSLTVSAVAKSNVLKSQVPSYPIPRLPLSNFIWDNSVAHHGDKIALVITFAASLSLLKKASWEFVLGRRIDPTENHVQGGQFSVQGFRK